MHKKDEKKDTLKERRKNNKHIKKIRRI